MDRLATGTNGYFRRRWAGAVSSDRLLFIDMLLVGSVLNLTTTFASLVVLGLKFPVWASLAVYALPIPYNIFLTISLWRATARDTATRSSFYRLAGLTWLAVASVL